MDISDRIVSSLEAMVLSSNTDKEKRSPKRSCSANLSSDLIVPMPDSHAARAFSPKPHNAEIVSGATQLASRQRFKRHISAGSLSFDVTALPYPRIDAATDYPTYLTTFTAHESRFSNDDAFTTILRAGCAHRRCEEALRGRRCRRFHLGVVPCSACRGREGPRRLRVLDSRREAQTSISSVALPKRWGTRFLPFRRR